MTTGSSNNDNCISVFDKDATITIHHHHFDTSQFVRRKPSDLPQLQFNNQSKVPHSILKKTSNYFNQELRQGEYTNSNVSTSSINSQIYEMNKYKNENQLYGSLHRSSMSAKSAGQIYRPNEHQCKRLDSRYQSLDNNWRNRFSCLLQRGILIISNYLVELIIFDYKNCKN